MLDLERQLPDQQDTFANVDTQNYADVGADAIVESGEAQVVEPVHDDFPEAITAPAEYDDGADAGDGPAEKDPDVDWGASDPIPEGVQPDPDEVELTPGDGGNGGEPPFDEPPIGGGDFADDEPDDGESDHTGEAAEPQEVRLPMGIANEFFERSGAETGDFAQHPQTAEDWHNNAIYSMASLAEIEHEALVAGEDRGQAEREGTILTNLEGADGGTIRPSEEVSGEYDVSTYQGSRNPAPNVVANYVEHFDADTGEMEYVVKVQPEIPLPEFGENASLAEVQAQYAAYEAATANPTEFVWESQQAQRVHVLRGDAPAVEMQQLPVDQMIEAARFLRNAAIRGALARRNIRVAERLLPLE